MDEGYWSGGYDEYWDREPQWIYLDHEEISRQAREHALREWVAQHATLQACLAAPGLPSTMHKAVREVWASFERTVGKDTKRTGPSGGNTADTAEQLAVLSPIQCAALVQKVGSVQLLLLPLLQSSLLASGLLAALVLK